MEHFNDSLKVPFFDATTKFNPSTPKSQLSRHLPCVTGRCRGRFRFFIERFAVGQLKKRRSDMKLLIFLGESRAYSPGTFWDLGSLKTHFLQFWGHFSANFPEYFGKYFIFILAFGVRFTRYIRIYVGIYTAEINHHNFKRV